MLAALASALVTLCMGAVRIPIETTWAVLQRHLFGQSGRSIPVSMEQIVWQIRVPRIILGFLAGSGLALCGCVMQAVVQNPMADPYILGVSAGATLGATGSLFLGVGIVSGFWAFLGAGFACFLVLALASADGKTTSVKLILAGMIVNALLTAFSNFIIAVAGNSDGIMSIKFWTMGSLTRAGWKNIGLIAVIVLLAALFFMSQARTLDGLLLGEEAAVTIGIDTFRCRLVYLLMLSLLTGALISACGTIGFVGLIIPHLARALVGTAHRKLLPVAALSGGLFMLWVDALARSLLPNTELPVGIFTALIGAPFFVYVMVRKRYGFGGK
ncbi:FecCD family ABC transporter permease [Stomatobaculum longum]|uniref:FecCD family ABC transporter permease n=1 Tax=Stomatobaculum longum TaxID=796942 RepID=UPI002FE6D4E6